MTTSRRAYHHGGLRDAILRSAAHLLEKQGVEGLSLREAARRARVSHAAPYRHFPDRESLLAALAHPQRFRLMFGSQLRMARHPALREIATKTFQGLSGALAARVGDTPGA